MTIIPPPTSVPTENDTPAVGPILDDRVPSPFRGLQFCPAWCYILFFSVLMPTNFSLYLGELRFAPYRFVLIVAFFPCMLRLILGRCGGLLPSDKLLLGFAIWNLVVVGYHHGMEVMVESGGVQSLELLGAYLIARTAITNAAQFVGTMSVLMIAIAVVVPFTLYESLTGHHFIKQAAASLMGGGFHSGIDPRHGFHRAFGPFDHPILWGIFAASALGVAWTLLNLRKTILDLSSLGVIALGALTSVSSGAVVAIMIQILVAVYERLTRDIRTRWTIFFVAMLTGYTLIAAFSTRNAFMAILARISFSPETAYGRTIIFEHGMNNVWASPIFGIGFNEWARPSWLSASVDNFWLLTAMTYGIPGFLLLTGAVLAMLTMQWKLCTGIARTLRTGWTISMVGMIVAGCTVHFWNSAYVYFAFLLGCGSVFCTGALGSPRHLGHGGWIIVDELLEEDAPREQAASCP